VLLAALAAPCARALLNFEGTRNQVFVFGSAAYAYSSNIFYDATNRGDSSVNTEAGIELKRRAGIIAVDSTAKISYQRFSRYSEENNWSPNFALAFSKETGRTTGSLSVKAFRESRSDTAVNLRTDSWNFPVSLVVKYPLNEKVSLASGTGFLHRSYSGSALLTNYTDFSESLDAFYVYTSKLDLVAGYRLRISKTTIGERTYDHWFNVGASGALFAKINGIVRFGYQVREISHGENFGNTNASAELNWTVTRRFALAGLVSRDFNTIATGFSVDTASATLRASYALNRKTDIESSVSYGRNAFLGSLQQNRRDDFFSWELSVHRQLTDHFRLAATYSYLHNWSTLSFADFDRRGCSLEVSARY